MIRDPIPERLFQSLNVRLVRLVNNGLFYDNFVVGPILIHEIAPVILNEYNALTIKHQTTAMTCKMIDDDDDTTINNTTKIVGEGCDATKIVGEGGDTTKVVGVGWDATKIV
uniref:Uncharacterized protein n=1 Tax=Romanomermis culicivorax TaxID=13658 RepID=A0A915J7S7_ROMCU